MHKALTQLRDLQDLQDFTGPQDDDDFPDIIIIADDGSPIVADDGLTYFTAE